MGGETTINVSNQTIEEKKIENRIENIKLLHQSLKQLYKACIYLKPFLNIVKYFFLGSYFFFFFLTLNYEKL